MPCLDLGLPPLPSPFELPSPFSLEPPTITFPSVGVNVCCVKKTFSLPPIPFPPLPPFGTPLLFIAFMAAFNAAEIVIQAWMDQYLVLSIPCPRGK